MTGDVKVMRSVSSLFFSIGLFSACGVLQRAIVADARYSDHFYMYLDGRVRVVIETGNIRFWIFSL
jgi:hypothetical protein